MATKPKVAKKKNAYEMPKKVKKGQTLVDNFKTKWIVGSSIGQGGFGEIYCVSKFDDKVKNEKDYKYVLKVEPHSNGPLFVEMHFYMRNAKQEDIDAFKKAQKIPKLGIPHFVGSGSEDIENIKHRFIILPRYGQDIWSIYLQNGKSFPSHTVCRLALQMLDVLQYIHSRTYVHGDLKGANMLMGDESQVYLVDFGLACRYTDQKEYKPDPKKMHNGTIEYTSIDAHHGVPTMRGDLEILGYNLIHWCGGTLPWEKCLTDPVKVKALKENYNCNAKSLMKDCFKKGDAPKFIETFLDYTYALEFNEQPNYTQIKKNFLQTIKSLNKSNTGPLEFSSKNTAKVVPKKTPPPAKKVVKEPKRTPVRTTRSSTPSTPNTQDSSLQSTMEKSTKVVMKAAKGKNKKQINFNIDLNVSVDADIIVNVRRKNKQPTEPLNETTESSVQSDEVISVNSDDEAVSDTPQSPPKSRKRRMETTNDKTKAAKTSRHEAVKVPKVQMRAGEYNGKKAK